MLGPKEGHSSDIVEKLKARLERQGARFISIDSSNDEWKLVKHWSRKYGSFLKNAETLEIKKMICSFHFSSPEFEEKYLFLNTLAQAQTTILRLEFTDGISTELSGEPTFSETGLIDSSNAFHQD